MAPPELSEVEEQSVTVWVAAKAVGANSATLTRTAIINKSGVTAKRSRCQPKVVCLKVGFADSSKSFPQMNIIKILSVFLLLIKFYCSLCWVGTARFLGQQKYRAAIHKIAKPSNCYF